MGRDTKEHVHKCSITVTGVPSLTQIWILAVGDLEQQYVAAREAQRSIPGLVKNCMLNPLTPKPMTKLMPTCDVPSHPSHVSCDGRSLVWKSGTAQKHEHCLLPCCVVSGLLFLYPGTLNQHDKGHSLRQPPIVRFVSVFTYTLDTHMTR